MRRMKAAGIGVAVVFGLSFLALSAQAQVSTGSIRGTVVDQEGMPLPGATVTASSASVIRARTAVTGSNGEFNFSSLQVGLYDVQATLAGFQPAEAKGVRVLLGGTTTLNLQLPLAGMVDTIEVVGQSETILDPTDTGTGGRVTAEELVKVPTARDPWAVLALVPGIQSDRTNVGGTQSGQQANFIGRGDDGTNTVWTLDGVNITDPGATGSSATYYDFGSLEEVQISTGGNSVSQLTGGIGINIVTKRGSNEFHGSARATFTGEDLQQDNISEELENSSGDPDAPFQSPKVHRILEFGGEVGGPILADKLWFWGSASRNRIEQRTITGDPDETTLTNFAGKLSVQISDQNEANAFFNHNSKDKKGRDAGPDRPPKSTWNQETPVPLFKVEDQHLFGTDTLLTGKFAYVGGYFTLNPQGGSLETGNPDAPMAAYDDATGNWDDTNFQTYRSESSQTMFHLDGSHFRALGSTNHDFKFGFSYRDTPVESRTFWDGGAYVIYNRIESGTSEEFDTAAVVWADQTYSFLGKTLSAYLSDTLTWNALTVDLGLRFDRQTARNGEGRQNPNPLGDVFSELTVRKDEADLIQWSNLAPRLGVTYQVGEKVLVKANYAYYADQLPGRLALSTNPISGYDYFYTYFDDGNGDRQVQEEELIRLAGYPCGGLCIFVNGFSPDGVHGFTTDLLDPDLKSPKTQELVLGLSFQPAPETSVGVNFTARSKSDLVWRVPLVIEEGSGNIRPVQFEDWVALPDDPEFQGEGAASGDFEGNFRLNPYTVQAYTLQDGLSLLGGLSQVTNRPDYSQRYLSAEVLFQQRFGEKGSVGASFSLSDWTEHFTVGGEGDVDRNRTTTNPGVDGGPVAPQSTGSGAFAEVYVNAKWQGNLHGSYSIPRIAVDLGASLTVRQGYPSPFTHRGFTGIAGASSGVTEFLVGELDDYRMETLANLDLRLGKEIRFAKTGTLDVAVDLFNVFNRNTLLQHRLVANRDNFLQPTEILGPRLLRLSVQLKF